MRKWGWFSVAWAIQAAPMALTGGVAPALAASDSSTGITANSQQASETEVLQEITIVAQRRRENLQDVPISVTAISGSQLAHSGVESTQDLPMSVPGLTMPQSAGYLLPHIRGVGTTTMGAGLENSVATYIDGVYIASPTAALLKFNDIQQVEVLKGPQGTLFGRNATGGAILIATREPAQDLQGEAHLGYGNYATLDSNLYVNGGISNDVAANLAVNYVRMGEGYGTNIFNGQDLYRTDRNLALRSAWKFDFSDVATLVVSLDYENTAGNMNSSIGEAKGVIPLFGALPPLRSVWDADVDTQPYERFSGGGASAKLTYDLGFGHLVSITAYRRSDYRVGFDGDETPIPAVIININDQEHQGSQEFQLQSPDSNRIKWILGAFYFGAKGRNDPFETSGLALNAVGLQSGQIIGEQKTTALAGYAQATAEVLPATNLTLGVRDSYEKREINVVDQGVTALGVLDLVPPVNGKQTSSNRPTWRVALDHHFTSDVMGYLSYDRGFKSGGFNVDLPTDPAFKPEVLDAYQAGLKAELLSRRLRLNPAFFYYDYSNIQVTRFEGAGQIGYYNGAGAKIYGMDLDLQAALTDRFTVSAGLELLRDWFTSFPNAIILTPLPTGGMMSTVGSAKDNHLPYTPDLTFNLAADYVVPVRDGDIHFNATYFHSATWWSDPANILPQPAYDLINASAQWLFGEGRYSVELWGKNLANKAVASQINASALSSVVYWQAPRTYGVTLGVKF